MLGRHLAGLCITLQLVGDLLAFIQAVHAGAFNRAHVNEYVLAAVRRRDETKTLGGIEPLNCTNAHNEPFQWQCYTCPYTCTDTSRINFEWKVRHGRV
ncbi:hypothetical protein ABI_16800 [Asticcacaulis biprosthecium C19]|uniref:Uncharacterized protein n=1 Tax=Asticcacaulis biprosthecium C19 TaxID=715226 RepID=F4QJY3_9CAUL|nr:hypothetical protein ABI_16800 [Asticcacaulis biprosthecium C19]